MRTGPAEIFGKISALAASLAFDFHFITHAPPSPRSAMTRNERPDETGYD